MNRRIAELDGWRAVSVCLVLLGHLLHFALSGPREFADRSAYPRLVEIDTLGVSIFFAISGFIITRLALAERQQTGGYSIPRFWLRRVFRILPALIAYLIAITLLQRAGAIVHTFPQTLRGLSFVCNLPSFSDCGWFTGHLWSLAVEEQFYLVFPLLFAFVPRRLFGWATALGWLCAALFPTLAAAYGHGGGGVFVNPFTFLMAGVLMAIYETEVKSVLTRNPAYGWTLCLAVVAVALALPGRASRAHDDLIVTQLVWLALPVAVCGMIALTCGSDGRVARMLRHPLLQTLGQMSYSLYLWQQLWLGSEVHYANGSWLTWLPALPIVAWLSWRLIERPSARWCARLLASRRPAC